MAIAGAQQLLQSFLDQCSSGSNAELRLSCENGRLRATLSADLGFLKAEKKTEPAFFWGGRVSPSRARRRERRAAERVLPHFSPTAEKAEDPKAAEEAAAEKILVAVRSATPVKIAAEETASKAAMESIVAKADMGSAEVKANMECAAAEKAAETESTAASVTSAVESATGKAAVVSAVAPKSAESGAEKTYCESIIEKTDAESSGLRVTQELFAESRTDIAGNAASTSCLGNQTNCRNCGENFTPGHQCDGFSEPPPEVGEVTSPRTLNPVPRKYSEPPSKSSNCEIVKAVSSVTPPGSPKPAKTRGWGPPIRRRIY